MASEQRSRQTLELRDALSELSREAGVQREDLLEALNGELRALQQCWSVNLANGVSVARKTIIADLRAHVSRITLPRVRGELSTDQLRLRYAHAVLVSFNALDDRDHAALMEMDLMARRHWLHRQAAKKYWVSPSTSQRYLNHAIAQIEQQILASGYEPVRATDVFNQRPTESTYIERPALQQQVAAALTRKPRVVAVIGLPGYGKTRLLRWAVDEYFQPKDVLWLDVAADTTDRRTPSELRSRIGQLSSRLTRKPQAIALDGLADAYDLLGLRQDYPQATVFLTCHYPLWSDPPGGCTQIAVGPMERSEALAFLRSLIPSKLAYLPDRLLLELAEALNFMPFAMRQVAEFSVADPVLSLYDLAHDSHRDLLGMLESMRGVGTPSLLESYRSVLERLEDVNASSSRLLELLVVLPYGLESLDILSRYHASHAHLRKMAPPVRRQVTAQAMKILQDCALVTGALKQKGSDRLRPDPYVSSALERLKPDDNLTAFRKSVQGWSLRIFCDDLVQLITEKREPVTLGWVITHPAFNTYWEQALFLPDGRKALLGPSENLEHILGVYVEIKWWPSTLIVGNRSGKATGLLFEREANPERPTPYMDRVIRLWKVPTRTGTAIISFKLKDTPDEEYTKFLGKLFKEQE